mgnify:FL=1
MADNNSIIQSTKDYEKFSLIKGNRILIPGHVARLTTSILQKNMLPQNPIIVNEKFEVIDGQHRLEVARNNDLDIFYIVVPGARFEEIIVLNSNNKVWNSTDYINSYASQGDKDFLWIKEFIENYAISVTQALMFLFGSEGTAPRTALRRGRLTLSQEQKDMAEKRADVLWEIRPFMVRSGFVPRAFLFQMMKKIDEGLGNKLVKGVKAKGSSFVPASEKKNAINQLKELIDG